MTAPPPVITPELRALLRRVELGKLLDTFPERLAHDRGPVGHHHKRHLRPADLAEVDRPAVEEQRNELCSLRFVDAGHNVVIMGPVGVGKTFLATASVTPPSAAATASISSGPTPCSAGSARHGSTTATTPKSASCSASTC